MENGYYNAAKKAEELSNGAAYVVFGGTTAAVIIGEIKLYRSNNLLAGFHLKKNQNSFAQH